MQVFILYKVWSPIVYFTFPLLISSPQRVVPFYSPVLAFMRTIIREMLRMIMIRAMLRMIMIRAVRMLRLWKIMWMMMFTIVGLRMTIRNRMRNFVKQSYLALSSAFMMLRDCTESTWKMFEIHIWHHLLQDHFCHQNHYLRSQHFCQVFWYNHQKHQNRRHSFFSRKVMRTTTSHHDLWCCWRFWTRQRFTE